MKTTSCSHEFSNCCGAYLENESEGVGNCSGCYEGAALLHMCVECEEDLTAKQCFDQNEMCTHCLTVFNP